MSDATPLAPAPEEAETATPPGFKSGFVPPRESRPF